MDLGKILFFFNGSAKYQQPVQNFYQFSDIAGSEFFLKYRIRNITTNIPIMGKIAAISIPAFIPTCSAVRENFSPRLTAKLLSETKSTIAPSICGATELPKSPPAAISA